MEKQPPQTESERIKAWKTKEEERTLRQTEAKSYKYTLTLLLILWIGLILYTCIVGIEHVMNSNTGLLSIIFSTGVLVAVWYAKFRKAKQIRKKREQENTENTSAS